MTSFEHYFYNQKIQLKLAGIIERMLENEQKSSSEGTQERKEDQAQSGETGRKNFDQIYIEEDLKCLEM